MFTNAIVQNKLTVSNPASFMLLLETPSTPSSAVGTLISSLGGGAAPKRPIGGGPRGGRGPRILICGGGKRWEGGWPNDGGGPTGRKPTNPGGPPNGGGGQLIPGASGLYVSPIKIKEQ